jgi:hypothetical protein
MISIVADLTIKGMQNKVDGQQWLYMQGQEDTRFKFCKCILSSRSAILPKVCKVVATHESRDWQSTFLLDLVAYEVLIF